MADARVLAGRPTALSVLSDADGEQGGAPGARWSRCSRAYGYLSIELFDREGARLVAGGLT